MKKRIVILTLGLLAGVGFAADLELTAAARYNKNRQQISKSYVASISITGANLNSGTITVGITDSQVPLGGVTTNGWFIGRNMDFTNYIQLGLDGTNYLIRANPGEMFLFRVNSTNVHWKANTAPCVVDFSLFEN